MKRNAPDWFAAVFYFMMKDLNRISTVSMEVATYKAQCETNSKEIKELCQKVDTLEKRNVELEANIQKLETYSKKNNLIIKGVAEKGPKEDAMSLTMDFLANNLIFDNPGNI